MIWTKGLIATCQQNYFGFTNILPVRIFAQVKLPQNDVKMQEMPLERN